MPDPRRIRVTCRNCAKALAVAKEYDGKGRCPKCGALVHGPPTMTDVLGLLLAPAVIGVAMALVAWWIVLIRTPLADNGPSVGLYVIVGAVIGSGIGCLVVVLSGGTRGGTLEWDARSLPTPVRGVTPPPRIIGTEGTRVPVIVVGMAETRVRQLLGKPKSQRCLSTILRDVAANYSQIKSKLGQAGRNEYAIFDHPAGEYNIVFRSGTVVEVYSQPSPKCSEPATPNGETAHDIPLSEQLTHDAPLIEQLKVEDIDVRRALIYALMRSGQVEVFEPQVAQQAAKLLLDVWAAPGDTVSSPHRLTFVDVTRGMERLGPCVRPVILSAMHREQVSSGGRPWMYKDVLRAVGWT